MLGARCRRKAMSARGPTCNSEPPTRQQSPTQSAFCSLSGLLARVARFSCSISIESCATPPVGSYTRAKLWYIRCGEREAGGGRRNLRGFCMKSARFLRAGCMGTLCALPVESPDCNYDRRRGMQWGTGGCAMVDRPRDPRDEGTEESHESHWVTSWVALALVLACVGHFVVLHLVKHHRPIKPPAAAQASHLARGAA